MRPLPVEPASIATPNYAGPRPGRMLEPLFWRIKSRIATNHLRDIKRHHYVHVAAGVFTIALLLTTLLVGFSFIFHWLLHPEQQPFGAPMLKRLVGMTMLAFFSMLTFSNLIIMLTTTYISREVEFLMAQPISHRRLYFCKFSESSLYSSWAFLILAVPFFVALAGIGDSVVVEGGQFMSVVAHYRGWRFRDLLPAVHWSFPFLVLALLLPFLAIPASVGAILSMIVTAYFPAKRAIRLAAALALIGIGGTLLYGRFAGTNLNVGDGRMAEIGRVMKFLGIGDVPWFPSTWFARGVRAALVRDWKETFFWGSMLYSTSFLALDVCRMLAGRLYYRGFCSSRSSGTSRRTREGGLYRLFDSLLSPIPSSTRALMVKDLTVFWRDPAQWGQLMVLFGLLFIYIANLGNASQLSRYRIDFPMFKSLMTLFNLGSTSFILSILTTRFVYPMLSLEGKQQWVIGLAPLGATRLVWSKYALCWFCSLCITAPLVLLSCYMLRADAFVVALSLGTILMMSLGLNSLAIGLGALMPNFQEDNPARIANGLGGTVNIVASMLYVALTCGLLFGVIVHHVTGREGGQFMQFMRNAAVPMMLGLHALVIVVPLRLGLRHWRRLEF